MTSRRIDCVFGVLCRNQWVGKVDKLLDVLDKSNHLIHKEAMAHKVSLE